MGRHQQQRKKPSAAAVGLSCLAMGALTALGFTAVGAVVSGSPDGSLVQSTGAYAYTAEASVSKHYDQDVKAGDLLTVAVNYDAAGSADATVTDSLGDTFTQDGNQHGAAADRALAVFHATAKASGDDTVKATFSAARTQRYIVIAEYSAGTDASTPPPSDTPTTSTPTDDPTTSAPPSSDPPASSAAPTDPPSTQPTDPPTSETPAPAQNGFPNASNTGVPAGTVLHACTYSSSVKSYDSCKFAGGISVSAPNVTITKSLIQGQVKSNSTGLTISDSEISCNCGSSASGGTPPAVAFDGFTLLRDNIHGSGHGVQIDGQATVRDSYIHDLCCTNNQAHADAIISNGTDNDKTGAKVIIDHNNLDGAGAYMSAAVGLFGDFGPITNFQITNNLLNTTGSYCLYGGDSSPSSGKKYLTATNMVVTGNHFGKADKPKCGIYGPTTAFGNNVGNVWSGNVWDDTGAAINP